MMFHHSTVPQVWCQKHLPYGSYHEFVKGMPQLASTRLHTCPGKGSTTGWSSSEVPSHTKFENPSLNDAGRPPPRAAIGTGVGCGFGERGVRVDCVVDV